MKIVAAMGAALAIAVVVGLVGLFGVRATYRMVEDMYCTNVQAIVAVSAVRRAIIDDRLALNRSIIDPSHCGAVKKIMGDKARMEAAWHRYYPDLLSSDDERKMAAQFEAALRDTQPLVEQEAALLEEGKTADGRALRIPKTADGMSREAAAVERSPEPTSRPFAPVLVRRRAEPALAAAGDSWTESRPSAPEPFNAWDAGAFHARHVNEDSGWKH